MYWIGIMMVFVSFFLISIGVVRTLTFRRKTVLRRMDQFTQVFNEKEQMETIVLGNTAKKKEMLKAQDNTLVKKYTSKMENELAKADILLHPQEYVLLVTGFAFLLGLLLYMMTQNSLMGLMGILIGVIISRIFVSIKKNQRVTKLNHQLVDTITLISNGLKAGYSFFQAAEMVARDMRPPIADEFKKMIRQMNLGMTAEEALKRLGERVESQDMDLVITAILIQRQIGGNLAEVLDSITHTIRERIRMQQEIKAKTAQGRISGVILMVLPFALGLIIYILVPSFMQTLFTTTLGWMITGVAVLLQIIGIFFIVKIINIEV